MAWVPKRGDIIHLAFEPSAGQEMKGKHYGLVMSGKEFNQSGLAFVCPISQGAAHAARSAGLMVTLMGAGTDTVGTIHCHQIKSLDWRKRQATHKEEVPEYIVKEVQSILEIILNG